MVFESAERLQTHKLKVSVVGGVLLGIYFINLRQSRLSELVAELDIYHMLIWVMIDIFGCTRLVACVHVSTAPSA